MAASSTPAWRGINHLALVTSDMDATVRFYHSVLGARLVATIGTPEFRHYFFDFGPQCTVAFFEYADLALEPLAKAAGVPIDGHRSSTTSRSTSPTMRRSTRCDAASPRPPARSPRSSTTAASGPCTSRTTTASPSKRPGGSVT